MKVIDVRDIVRKDLPIYYRRLFTGIAVIDILDEKLERRIEFCIETQPTGAQEVSVNLLDHLEYPLVPVLRELKNHVAGLDRTGALP